MPHICLRCKAKLEAATGLAPCCPACGGTKFSFVSAKKKIDTSNTLQEPVPQIISDISVDVRDEEEKNPGCNDCNESNKVADTDIVDSIESIRIIEPGRYNLNLLKLVESDDRVIQVGADGKYRLDLFSMVRKNKK
jgi:hypothetical protein